MDFKIVRATCYSLNLADHQRQAFKRDVPDFFETLLGGSFRSFVSVSSGRSGSAADEQNAAMIAGISIILNPQTPHAADMKEILRLFMEQHPLNPKADDFTQQEATIVSFTKSSMADWADSADCYTAPSRCRSRVSPPTCQTASNQHFCRTKSTYLVPS
jgi:hypothetical protein